jgi:hypothetical protein
LVFLTNMAVARDLASCSDGMGAQRRSAICAGLWFSWMGAGHTCRESEERQRHCGKYAYRIAVIGGSAMSTEGTSHRIEIGFWSTVDDVEATAPSYTVVRGQRQVLDQQVRLEALRTWTSLRDRLRSAS